MQFIATCGCQGAVLESNSHINRMTYFTYIHLSEQKKSSSQKQKSSQMEESVHIPWPWSIWDLLVLFPPKNPKETGKQLLQFTFHIEATESRGGPRSRGGKLLHVLSGGLQILHMQYTLENEGGGGDLKNTQFLDGSWWWKCLNTKYKKCSLIFLNKPLSWKHETFSSWEGTICRHYLTGGPSWQEMGAAFGEELFRILEGDTLGGHRNKQQGNNVDADPQQQLGTWCQAGLGSPWSTIQPIQFCQAMPSPPSFSSDWQHMSDDCTFRTWIRASTFKNNSTKHHRHPLGVVLRSFFYFCTMVNHHGNKTGFEIIFCPKHVKSSLCKARLRWTPQFGLKF